MSDKMLKFVDIGQQTPPKREVDNRKKDFNEFNKYFFRPLWIYYMVFFL